MLIFFPESKNAIRFGHVQKTTLVNELIDLYLERIKQHVSDNTYDRYKKTCNKHLRPTFGKLPVIELSAGIIWDWLNKFKCQRKTILNILTPLRYVVAEAMIWGYLKVNPFTLIDLRLLAKVKSTYKVNPFTQCEIYKLLAAAEGQIKKSVSICFLYWLAYFRVNWFTLGGR